MPCIISIAKACAQRCPARLDQILNRFRFIAPAFNAQTHCILAKITLAKYVERFIACGNNMLLDRFEIVAIICDVSFRQGSFLLFINAQKKICLKSILSNKLLNSFLFWWLRRRKRSPDSTLMMVTFFSHCHLNSFRLHASGALPCNVCSA